MTKQDLQGHSVEDLRKIVAGMIGNKTCKVPADLGINPSDWIRYARKEALVDAVQLGTLPGRARYATTPGPAAPGNIEGDTAAALATDIKTALNSGLDRQAELFNQTLNALGAQFQDSLKALSAAYAAAAAAHDYTFALAQMADIVRGIVPELKIEGVQEDLFR